MSLWRDELKPSTATLASLIVLASVAVAGLARVIEAPGVVGWSVAALAVGAAFALYFGQRSLGVGFGLLIAFGGFSLPMLFLEDQFVPTPSAFSDIRALIASAFEAIPKATPPVPAEPRFTILIWLALLLLGFLCAAWVVVRRPVGAVVSLLSVVTFTGSVGEGGGRNTIAVLAVAATGAFFLAEGRHRIARWGGGRISMPTWLGLPTLAVACVVAFGAPLLLGETPIVKLQSAIRPRVVIIKPLSDIRTQLKVDPPLEVMRVTSRKPTYWRLTGLDRYDGNEWVLEARPRNVLKGDVRSPEPKTTGEVLEQKYRLTNLLSPWLPAVYAAEKIDSEAVVQLEEGSQTLLLRDDIGRGHVYTVTSRMPAITQNIPADLKISDDPLARQVLGEAQRIAGNAQTPLNIARQMEKHFKAYTYDEDVARGHSIARLKQFLAARRGYCEQFAAAMTLMLRSLGIEARVGVGFLPGTTSAGGFIVSTRDAHAWVEAKLPGAGWATFDPTPGRAEASSIPPTQQDAPPAPEIVPQVTTVPQPTPEQNELPEDVLEEPELARAFPMEIVYATLAIAAVSLVPTLKTMRRRRRARGKPDVVVVGAYAELVDRARDLGHRQRSSETVREFLQRVLRSDDNAERLGWLSSRALYGPSNSTAQDASEAWNALRRAESALRGRTPIWRRALAFFDPRTLLPQRPFRRARVRVASALGRA